MRRLLVALVVGSVLMAGAAPAVLAKAAKIPVAGTSTTVGMVDPGKTVTFGSVEFLRGMVVIEKNVTDNARTTGEDWNTINYILDHSTGRGMLWGTGIHHPTADPDGTWRCVFYGTFAGGGWTGKGFCQGTGSLRGWQWRADLTGLPTGSMNQGYLFPPGH